MYKIQIHKDGGKLDSNITYIPYKLVLDSVIVGKFGIKLQDKFYPENSGYLCDISIYPEFRDKGIGTSSLKKIIKLFKKLGKKSIYLIVDINNKIAQKFFLNCGFKFTGKKEEFCWEMIYEITE